MPGDMNEQTLLIDSKYKMHKWSGTETFKKLLEKIYDMLITVCKIHTYKSSTVCSNTGN